MRLHRGGFDFLQCCRCATEIRADEESFAGIAREGQSIGTEERNEKSSVFPSATRTRNNCNELQFWHLNCCLRYLNAWVDVAWKN